MGIWRSNYYINMPLVLLFAGDKNPAEEAPQIRTRKLDK
jgi:hypothetical protein